MIGHHQNSANIAYKNKFDDYLLFPIIEQQFNFRFSLLHNYSLSHNTGNANAIELDPITLKQKPDHIKLAKSCANYLVKNIEKDYTLAELAKIFCTNRNSLAIAFKAVYGCGVFTWLRKERLVLAHKMLESTTDSIQTISYRLGFSDAANFSRSYKQEFGQSPRYARTVDIPLENGKLHE